MADQYGNCYPLGDPQHQHPNVSYIPYQQSGPSRPAYGYPSYSKPAYPQNTNSTYLQNSSAMRPKQLQINSSYAKSSAMSPSLSNSSRGSHTSGSSQGQNNYGSSTATSPESYVPSSPIEFSYSGPSNSTTRKPSKRSSSSPDGSSPSYPCLYPECSYAPKRQYDLDRHMKKHFPPNVEDMFDCPGRGCNRTGLNGFRRKDHMNEHLVNFHLWDPKTKKPRPKERR